MLACGPGFATRSAHSYGDQIAERISTLSVRLSSILYEGMRPVKPRGPTSPGGLSEQGITSVIRELRHLYSWWHDRSGATFGLFNDTGDDRVNKAVTGRKRRREWVLPSRRWMWRVIVPAVCVVVGSATGHWAGAIPQSVRTDADASHGPVLTSATVCGGVLAPAYFYPGTNWQQLLSTTPAGSAVIVNPQSGPGSTSDPNYAAVVSQARAEGLVLYGYVDTMDGSLSLALAENEIDDYAQWYGITNIFFDNASTNVDELGYYQALTADVRATATGSLVMLNFGTYPPEVYMGLGDTAIVFEGPYSSFVVTPPPAWMSDYPSNRFGVFLTGVPANELSAAIAQTAAWNDGYVYITEMTAGPTLYEQLPSYWSDEVRMITAECTAGSTPLSNYWEVASDGGVFTFGDAGFYGSTGSMRLNTPIVGLAATPDGRGYWEVAADGGIFTFGDAGFYGSAGAIRLNMPIVGLAATPDGRGYWEVAADGGIFTFGDAGFYGSTGAMRLNMPIVGLAATPDGRGYWEVAADGGIFTFGDAGFYGSTGSIRLNKPIVGMAATPDGKGYWEVASDGGIFTFGDAGFYGSTGSIRLNKPIVGMAATPDGKGYWEVASDGGVFTFGDAGFYGSEAGTHLNSPIVGLAAS